MISMMANTYHDLDMAKNYKFHMKLARKPQKI